MALVDSDLNPQGPLLPIIRVHGTSQVLQDTLRRSDAVLLYNHVLVTNFALFACAVL